MSPTMPLLYSMKARQPRGWTRLEASAKESLAKAAEQAALPTGLCASLLVQAPPKAVAGETFTVRATALDAKGVPAVLWKGRVELRSTDPPVRWAHSDAEGATVEMYPLPGRPMAYPENLSEEIMTETRISPRAIQLLDGLGTLSLSKRLDCFVAPLLAMTSKNMTVHEIPTLNAALNATATVLISAGFVFIKQKKIKAVFVESSVPHDTIERISRDAGVKIGGELFSDAMGTPGQIEHGYDLGTYEGMIKHNLTTIVEALK